MIPAGFHFLRPEWLFAFLPALLLAALAWRGMGKGREDWRHLVDAHLLRHLALRDEAHRSRWPVAVLLAGWALAVIAMAGPAWQKVPTPTLERLDPTVVVLSLAQTMDAKDQSPSRLIAARHKVEDILSRMRGGQVALVIYADAPFVAAPLTEDGRVIAQMLPELATDLMPVRSDRPDLAIDKAVELLKNTGAPTGRIVLVTDGAGEVPAQTTTAVSEAARSGYTVSVVGVGAPSAGTSTGAAAIPGVDAERLAALAAAGNGRYMPLTADGRDLDTILTNSQAVSPTNPLQATGLTADQWVDMGSWLLIAVALVAPLAFRRGWLAAIPLAALLTGMAGEPARAQGSPQQGQGFVDPAAGLTWQELWQTPDQKGASAFSGEDYGAAAKAFQNPAWQASSLYKDGDFDSAASAFSKVPGADYNRGNALARAGKLEEAVKAYDAALSADPGNADATFNRDLVLKALEEQKKQQQQQQNQQDQQNQQNQQNQQDQQKPDNKTGDGGQNKPDPKQNDQKQQADQKQGDQKQDDQKQDQAKNDPKADPKNDPKENPQNDPPKSQPPQQQNPGKPEGQGQQQPPPPTPPKQADAPPQPQPAEADKQQGPPPPPPGTVALQSMSEQDQNREQALRMVPDDPVGLLRARIRSHYLGRPVPAVEDMP